MGSYSFTNVAVKTSNSENEELIGQLIDCLVKKNSPYSRISAEQNEWNDGQSIYSERDIKCDYLCCIQEDYGDSIVIDTKELFELLQFLFGKTYLLCGYYGGQDTVDWYKEEKYFYNPDKGNVSWTNIESCAGEGTGNRSVFQNWKTEIEEEARSKNIEPKWTYRKDDKTLKPNSRSKDFVKLCNELLNLTNTFDEWEDDDEFKVCEEPDAANGCFAIRTNVPDENCLNCLISLATELEYTLLADKLSKAKQGNMQQEDSYTFNYNSAGWWMIQR